MGAAPPSVTETDPDRSSAPVLESPRGVPLPELDPDAYEVLGELARGGMGRIMRARDRRLDRPVALKQLLVNTPRMAALFEREIRITAKLQHPSIVNIYEAGTLPSGELAYAMKLVPGRPLRDVLREPQPSAARLAHLPAVIAVADALAYAHGHGVIHRDLKPANVLVGDFGEVVVIDWGLARELSAPAGAAEGVEAAPSPPESAVTAAAMGTPAYMAPEAAGGGVADARVDVYAIGAILYEALTGTPPYVGPHAPDVLAALKAGPPPSLEQVARGIPSDLRAIVRKAMARSPAERYASARELADELRRFQTGQLVSAHSYSWTERARRWSARNRAALVISLLSLTVVSVLTVLGVRRIVEERDVAAERADRLTLAQARLELDRDPATAVATLAALPVGSRGWSGARVVLADAIARGVPRPLLPGSVLGVSIAAVERVVVRDDSVVRVIERGRELVRWPAPAGALIAVARDGSAMAQLDAGRLVVWTLAHGASPVFEQPGPRVEPRLALAADGSAVVVAGADLGVRAWTLADGAEALREDARADVDAITIAPAARAVVIAARGRVVQYGGGGGSEITELAGPAVDALALADDGDVIAIARDATVWLVRAGAPPVQLRADGAVTSLAFAGSALLAATERSVLQWRLADGALVRTLRGARGRIRALAMARDGSSLVAGGSDGAYIWTLGDDMQTIGEAPRDTVLLAVARSVAATATNDGSVWTWDLSRATGRLLGRHAGAVRELVIAAGGTMAVSGSDDRTIRRWMLATGSSEVVGTHQAAVTALACTADGTTLVSGSADRTVRLWTPRGARVLGNHAAAVVAVAIASDGSSAASAADERDAYWWRLAGDGARVRLHHDAAVSALVMAHSGHRVITGTRDGAVLEWRHDGTSRLLARHAGPVRSLAISADGRRIASASDDRSALIFEDGAVIATLQGHEDQLRKIAFSPDGRVVVTVGEDSTVRVWDPLSGAGRVLHGARRSTDAGFADDGGRVITVGGDTGLLSWREDLPHDPRRLREIVTALVQGQSWTR